MHAADPVPGEPDGPSAAAVPAAEPAAGAGWRRVGGGRVRAGLRSGDAGAGAAVSAACAAARGAGRCAGDVAGVERVVRHDELPQADLRPARDPGGADRQEHRGPRRTVQRWCVP